MYTQKQFKPSPEFTYTDSEAGMQTETFTSLSQIVSHIENFGWNGDSEGVILQNNEPILEYVSREDGLTWRKADA